MSLFYIYVCFIYIWSTRKKEALKHSLDTYQWNIIESTEINLCIYSQPIFDKSTKNTQSGKDNLFNKWWWESWISIFKKMKFDPYLTPCTKINSKWIKDLNIRSETVKLLEENIRKKLNISSSQYFWILHQKHRQK